MIGEANSMMMHAAGNRQVVVIETRQLTAMILGATLLVGLVGCIGYVAGRSLTAAQYFEERAAVTSVKANPIVVDPAAERQASVRAPAAKRLPAPVKAAPAIANPAGTLPEPGRGQTFLQVGAMDRGMAELYVEMLARKGFRGQVAPGPDAKTFRVLVGPLAAAEIEQTKSALGQAGYSTFQRAY